MTPDRVELLVGDIEGSGEALGRLAATVDDGAGPWAGLGPLLAGVRRIALTGLGSSRYAALLVAADLRRNGFAAWAEYPAGAVATAPADDLLLIAISASGGTAEVVEAARQHRGTSRVLAITNRPGGSALAGVADLVLPLDAGDEASGIATRTFRASVAVLGLLAHRLTRAGLSVEALDAASHDLERVVADRAPWLRDVADRLDGAARIDVVADAADLGVAEQAALMLREAPRLPATAHETADWAHTAIYLAVPGHRAIVISGSPADTSLVGIVAGRGGASIAVGPETVPGAVAHIPVPPAADPYARAIVTSVVAELVAAELWRRTRAEERPASSTPAT